MSRAHKHAEAVLVQTLCILIVSHTNRTTADVLSRVCTDRTDVFVWSFNERLQSRVRKNRFALTFAVWSFYTIFEGKRTRHKMF